MRLRSLGVDSRTELTRQTKVWLESISTELIRSDLWLIVQHDVQQGTVDFHVAVVVNEAQLSKFVHEMAHAGPRGADHVRERLLADLCNDPLRRAVLAEIRQ